MNETTIPASTPPAPAAGSACRFKIVATTDASIKTFKGTAVALPGRFATLDELLIGLLASIVRDENLVLSGITIEASMESSNTNQSGGGQ